MHLSRGPGLTHWEASAKLPTFHTETRRENFVGEPKAALNNISDDFNHFKIQDPVCETSFGFIGCVSGRVTRGGLISCDRRRLTPTGSVVPASA
jgi:hypothetical protein